MIDGALVTTKGRLLQQLCNQKFSHDEYMKLSFNGGRLTKLKCRWGLNSFTCHRGSSNGDVNAAEKATSHLRERINA